MASSKNVKIGISAISDIDEKRFLVYYNKFLLVFLSITKIIIIIGMSSPALNKKSGTFREGIFLKPACRSLYSNTW